jgi:hypothetical protein
LRRVASDSICVQNDSTSLLVWMPIGDSSARKAMQEFSRDLRRDLGSTPLIAASDQCNDESDYTSAIKACQRTVALADRFGRSGLLSEEDFGPHALVLASMPQKDIEPFVRRTLGPLEDAGAQSGAHLVPTVEPSCAQVVGCRNVPTPSESISPLSAIDSTGYTSFAASTSRMLIRALRLISHFGSVRREFQRSSRRKKCRCVDHSRSRTALAKYRSCQTRARQLPPRGETVVERVRPRPQLRPPGPS